MAKHKNIAEVEPSEGMTLAEAEEATVRTVRDAENPQVASHAARIRKDGTPYANRGESLKWTAAMDEALVVAVRDNPGKTGQQIAEILWNVDALAEVIAQVTSERVRARVAYLRKALEAAGVGVTLGRLGRSTIKPDVTYLASLLGAGAATAAT